MEGIKAGDLRLGNWILDTECEPHHFEVEQISKHVGSEPWIRYRKDSIKAKRVEGIPLTEEWLKRFGFYQLPHFTVTNSWLFDLGRDRTLCVGSVGTPNLMVLIQDLQDEETKAFEQVVLHNWDYDGEMFVHELQNLVFSLSKKELTVAQTTTK